MKSVWCFGIEEKQAIFYLRFVCKKRRVNFVLNHIGGRVDHS